MKKTMIALLAMIVLLSACSISLPGGENQPLDKSKFLEAFYMDVNAIESLDQITEENLLERKPCFNGDNIKWNPQLKKGKLAFSTENFTGIDTLVSIDSETEQTLAIEVETTFRAEDSYLALICPDGSITRFTESVSVDIQTGSNVLSFVGCKAAGSLTLVFDESAEAQYKDITLDFF